MNIRMGLVSRACTSNNFKSVDHVFIENLKD